MINDIIEVRSIKMVGNRAVADIRITSTGRNREDDKEQRTIVDATIDSSLAFYLFNKATFDSPEFGSFVSDLDKFNVEGGALNLVGSIYGVKL